MTEFQIDLGSQDAANRFHDLDAFTRAYIEAMLWLARDWGHTDEYGGPDEYPDWTFEDLAPETLGKIIADCTAFRAANAAELEQAGDDEQNGHDFWLNRNQHGTGFEDRGYPDAIWEALFEASCGWRECDLCMRNDGKLYLLSSDDAYEATT